jgi:hypothetical protein
MTQDRQLSGVELARVIQKRRLDQALNAKEFAVLAGISYSTARQWFHAPGFPVFRGLVFWQDFVQWRTAENGLKKQVVVAAESRSGAPPVPTTRFNSSELPPRALKILQEAGRR